MMSTPGSLRYIYILLSSLICFGSLSVKAQTADTTAVADTVIIKPKPDLAGHQLTLGIDIVGPVANYFSSNKQGYEFAADYYLKNELYLAAEGGWGSSDVNYTDLKYNTSNTFYRLGFNKVLLPRENPTDWSGVILGLRVGTAFIDRSVATYTITDSLWGNSSGNIAGKTFNGYWMEVTGGVRLDLYKGIMAGWNIRGKFMLNGRSFNDLSPLYIAGYGRGDKNAVFDFNFYLSYAIRWKRAATVATNR